MSEEERLIAGDEEHSIVDRLNNLSRWLLINDIDMQMPEGMIDPAEAAEYIAASIAPSLVSQAPSPNREAGEAETLPTKRLKGEALIELQEYLEHMGDDFDADEAGDISNTSLKATIEFLLDFYQDAMLQRANRKDDAP